jgi:hypothetical protein
MQYAQSLMQLSAGLLLQYLQKGVPAGLLDRQTCIELLARARADDWGAPPNVLIKIIKGRLSKNKSVSKHDA